MSRKNPGVPLSEVANPASLVTEDGHNAYDLYCPLADCRCLILRKGVGKLVDMESELPQLPELPRLLNSPEESKEAPVEYKNKFWALSDMMSFENVGFSKTLSDTGVKYLICADCDVGPIGYHKTTQQQKDYRLVVDRVCYREQ
ncbi:Mss4-like protein [Basidiobolus meristosporus CBS 931.73]|uniref:Mss4-like protein n=1 Tax=Basidiobolus meristosporus CBS 931.73 TaxID=1314790 RepID=A0A1Y1Z713_9FUNG|nr:Mss4-like protein [Basidiobolus meristosporus CBS 931.73]|eukprot:ORY06062.1 Mss4-like protein [Basidiobolus meristosporus CBS 931.73]